MQTYSFELFADYHQIVLADESAAAEDIDITDDAIRACLSAGRHTLVVHTARNMTVPFTVHVHEREPAADLAEWDHVAECSIEVPSGRMVVAGLSDYWPDAARIELPPGGYRARLCARGLGTLSEDGLDGDDVYEVHLWQAPPGGVHVLKQYAPLAA